MAQKFRAAATDGDDIVQIRATELAGAALDGGIGNDILQLVGEGSFYFTPRQAKPLKPRRRQASAISRPSSDRTASTAFSFPAPSSTDCG